MIEAVKKRDVASGTICYDGLLTDHHRIVARELGPALVGADTIIASFLTLLETGEVQRRAPRSATLVLTVGEPRDGSFLLTWAAQVLPSLLPLVPVVGEAIQSTLVEHFVNYVLFSFGGRRRDADRQMDRMLDIIDRQMGREYEDRQRERENLRAMLAQQAGYCRGAAKGIVQPVGRSAGTLTISGGSSDREVIDAATADAIRAKEQLEVSDLMELNVLIEGIRDQKRQLHVYDPDDDTRTIPVHVADPAFNDPGNLYRQAYMDRQEVILTGKMTRNVDGVIKAFHAINIRPVT